MQPKPRTTAELALFLSQNHTASEIAGMLSMRKRDVKQLLRCAQQEENIQYLNVVIPQPALVDKKKRPPAKVAPIVSFENAPEYRNRYGVLIDSARSQLTHDESLQILDELESIPPSAENSFVAYSHRTPRGGSFAPAINEGAGSQSFSEYADDEYSDKGSISASSDEESASEFDRDSRRRQDSPESSFDMSKVTFEHVEAAPSMLLTVPESNNDRSRASTGRSAGKTVTLNGVWSVKQIPTWRWDLRIRAKINRFVKKVVDKLLGLD
ncbi:hypothetical protein J8273_2922 [Carpediemonas membranifera]|uniref:Uncharacterized protein n=1 Tax=Carpediemonas membranifera TaxID=201153 RepID=A0A8J6E0P1_9EUKA|nr:hypothetical protein J8273_2922 [Carpediemonas membranifera]|eukprot:KAG9395364.1 hypothetical protein J8273_2922 [Carpediemonas membranifera]